MCEISPSRARALITVLLAAAIIMPAAICVPECGTTPTMKPTTTFTAQRTRRLG